MPHIVEIAHHFLLCVLSQTRHLTLLATMDLSDRSEARAMSSVCYSVVNSNCLPSLQPSSVLMGRQCVHPFNEKHIRKQGGASEAKLISMVMALIGLSA